MPKNKTIVALDVGEKRIGVAVADTAVRIAVPFETVEVDGNEVTTLTELIIEQSADTVVVGYPRNQSGEPTAQTTFVEDFISKFTDLDATIVFQDESLTSVIAEQRLNAQRKPYTKADIDAQAAAIILQDYLESYYG